MPSLVKSGNRAALLALISFLAGAVAAWKNLSAKTRVWVKGLVHTLLTCAKVNLKVGLRLTNDPLRNLREEKLTCPDGETAVIWWSPGVSEMRDTIAQPVWVILPGGMSSGRNFYIRSALMHGITGGQPFCIFHNPGIVNRVKARSPAALTETTYLEHFLRMICARGFKPSLLGFSAGSMLAMKMSFHAESMPDLSLSCCVAVHGPDKIRSVFEAHERWGTRLDVFFSFSLYMTMLRAGCDYGIHESVMPYLNGWKWMRTYTERVFDTPWMQMEDQLWSCEDALVVRDSAQTCAAVPIFRILSAADPIVPLKTVKREEAQHIKIHVQPDHKGYGHCCAFDNNPDLIKSVIAWAREHQQR